MCKKCGINNSNCGCGFSSTYNTSSILFDNQDFICPDNFTLVLGESLNEVINTLAIGICTNAALLPNPGDQGPVGDQGIQGIQGVPGNPNGGFVFEYFNTYPTSGIQSITVPIVVSGSSHIATTDGLYQIHSIMYLLRGLLSEVNLTLWINGVIVDAFTVDNLSPNHEVINSFIFNWQGNVLLGQVIELKVEVVSVRIIYYGGSMLINRIVI
tara:strand:+ start:7289 stop:7924 length:636 start_codon:yes stop_codon:yes gene_type:complete